MGTLDFAETTDADGLAVPDPDDLQKEYQWIAIARGAAGRLAFLGFEGVWWGNLQLENPYDQNKAFAITDRPVYRPGQTMKFKFWVCNARYDAAPTSPFAGRKFKIRLANPRNEALFEKTFTADSYGGFDGEFALPSDASLGRYALSLVDPKGIYGGATFRVEEYKKPEFEVKVEAPAEPVRLGDKITATIRANYYFGGPVTQARVHYSVIRTAMTARWYPSATWDWLFGPGYWWFWPDYTWFPGWNDWGCLRPGLFIGASQGQPEVVLDTTTPIGPDGTVKVAIDTALAKTLHGDSDHRYAITAEVVDQSRRTIVGSGEVLVARKPFQIFSWSDRGYYQVGDAIHATFQAQTLDHKPVKGKGVVTLYRVTYSADGNPVETSAQTWDIATDERGLASLELKASQAGQYRLSYKLTDAKHQTIEGGLVLTVRGRVSIALNSASTIWNSSPTSASMRRARRCASWSTQIGSTARSSLFVRPVSSIYPRPQVVRLKGKSALVELAVTQKDMPNFFVEALTISNGQVFVENRQIVVPPEKRVVNVAVKPSAHDYKPGTKSGVKLKLTDLAGKPVVGSVVLAVYDKSVEYISGGSNIPEIREFFWNWRREHYPQTESSLAGYSEDLLKPHEVAMNGIGIFGDLMPGAGEGVFGEGFFGGMQGQKQAAGGMLGGFGSPVFQAEQPPGFYANAGVRIRDMAGKSAAWGPPISGTPIGLPGPPHLPNAAGAANEVQPTLRTQFADTAFWAATFSSPTVTV